MRRELKFKAIGLAFAFLLPLLRIALQIKVWSSFDWRWMTLILAMILIVWVWAATKGDPENRGDDLYINIALVVWGLVMTFLGSFN